MSLPGARRVSLEALQLANANQISWVPDTPTSPEARLFPGSVAAVCWLHRDPVSPEVVVSVGSSIIPTTAHLLRLRADGELPS